jgi:hypothetical protein
MRNNNRHMGITIAELKQSLVRTDHRLRSVLLLNSCPLAPCQSHPSQQRCRASGHTDRNRRHCTWSTSVRCFLGSPWNECDELCSDEVWLIRKRKQTVEHQTLSHDLPDTAHSSNWEESPTHQRSMTMSLMNSSCSRSRSTGEFIRFRMQFWRTSGTKFSLVVNLHQVFS